MILSKAQSFSGLASIVLITSLIVASLFDLYQRRVPNWLTLGGSLVAFLFVISGVSEISVTNALIGGAIGLAVFLPVYAFGKMGAGDVKLLGMCGLFLGVVPVLCAAIYAMLAGGVLALGYAAQSHWQTVEKPAATVPYAVAIATGVFFVLAGY